MSMRYIYIYIHIYIYLCVCMYVCISRIRMTKWEDEKVEMSLREDNERWMDIKDLCDQ